jgi:hypothetical protein
VLYLAPGLLLNPANDVPLLCFILFYGFNFWTWEISLSTSCPLYAMNFSNTFLGVGGPCRLSGDSGNNGKRNIIILEYYSILFIKHICNFLELLNCLNHYNYQEVYKSPDMPDEVSKMVCNFWNCIFGPFPYWPWTWPCVLMESGLLLKGAHYNVTMVGCTCY